MPTAMFVDAGFFVKRFPKVYRTKDAGSPSVVARALHELCLDHLTQKGAAERRDLYRIFVYDCSPIQKKVQKPISKRQENLSLSDVANFRQNLHQELKCLRKVALRLGELQDNRSWRVRPRVMKELLRGDRSFDQLTDDDFIYDIRQKGVDMKIGLDIASVAYKRQVDQIVLVSGDSDFVPAAKLARREGIDFILDPMWSGITGDLHEHIDGLRSTCPKPLSAQASSDTAQGS